MLPIPEATDGGAQASPEVIYRKWGCAFAGSQPSAGKDGGGGQRGTLRSPAWRGPGQRVSSAWAAIAAGPSCRASAHSERRRTGGRRVAIPAAGASAAPHRAAVCRAAVPGLAGRRRQRLLGMGQQLDPDTRGRTAGARHHLPRARTHCPVGALVCARALRAHLHPGKCARPTPTRT